ncbi:MAG: protein translocase subunit SecF [bacterium]
MSSLHRNFDIIGTRTRWYILSLVLILPGIISLIVWGLPVGIDFKGGTMQELHFTGTAPGIDQVRTELAGTKINGLGVQSSSGNDLIIRFPITDNGQARDAGNKILAQVKKDHPGATETSFQSIGGSVASSTTTKAAEAVVITSIAIIFFIAWSFGSVPKPASSWRFGVTAILALAHDILFMVGAFSLIGHFFPGVEVDSLFITAVLTILGFSTNDTIVVFDRIRENLRRSPGRSFAEIANSSLNQTLARSLNTSMTVLIVLITLLVLGGPSIRNFILALTLGVAIGTYSSIFNASPLLVSWQEFADRRAEKTAAAAKKK